MTKQTTMSRTRIRRLFAAGASVGAVLKEAGVRQRQVAEVSGWPQSRVAKVLAGNVGVTPGGRETALRIFEVVAELLGVPVGTIPAVRDLIQTEEA